MAGQMENSGRRGSVWRIVGWGAAGAVLLTPLVAMQFTDEVNWTPFDFVAAAVLLGVTGLAMEGVAHLRGDIASRIAFVVSILTALFLVWSNLAVGIIGNENNPLNMMFFGILAIGVLGAIAARFRPRGMAMAMFVTAALQAGGAIVAATSGYPPAPAAFFVVLWLASALLFRRSARATTAEAA